MIAYLASHVHAARIDDDLVILDIQADAYYCAPKLGAHLARPDGRGLTGLAPSDLERFRTAGLLSERWSAARALPLHPNRGLDLLPGRTPQLKDASTMAAALADLAFVYPLGSLSRLLSRVRPQSRPALSDLNPDVEQLALRFAGLAPWAPVGRKCLVRSFLLRRFLERSGQTADWVFGVRTWPFGAHCWLQCGEVALDDAPERLAPYQPIFCL